MANEQEVKSVESISDLEKLTANNKSLNEILKSTEAKTQEELAEASKRSEYVGAYLTVNEQLGKQVSDYLDKSQSYSQKFQTMIKNKNADSAKRVLRATPIIGKLFEDKMTPGKVQEVIKNMYESMILQKNGVSKQLALIKTQNGTLVDKLKQTSAEIKTNNEIYETAKANYETLEAQKSAIDAIMEADGVVTKDQLDLLKNYEIGTPNESNKLEIANLYIVQADILEAHTNAESDHNKAMIDLNNAKGAVDGYVVQLGQFKVSVRSTETLLYGLESHLKYTKEIVENQAILSATQQVNMDAVEAFTEYHNSINQILLMNSIGNQIEVRNTGKVLSTPIFDQEVIDAAKDQTKKSEQYWATFRQQYDAQATALSEKIKASRKT